MRLFVVLAAFDGCDHRVLDDVSSIEALLHTMVRAGRFTLFGVTMKRFEPQGVTGVALVGESHLALHSWPEEGRLFLDIASCTNQEAALDALEALKGALLHTSVEEKRISFAPEEGFR